MQPVGPSWSSSSALRASSSTDGMCSVSHRRHTDGPDIPRPSRFRVNLLVTKGASRR